MLILLAGAGFATSALAEVYRWIDQNGIIHYSDVPPAEGVERVAIETRPTDRERMQEQTEQDERIAREREFREEQEQSDAETADQRRAEVLRQREENCRIARERLETYLNSRRLYRPQPDGEREYLSDEELDAARADARQDVEQWCGTGTS